MAVSFVPEQIGAQVSVAHILASNRKELSGEEHRVWTQAVRDLGLGLHPYDCKASYVCGMLRQFIEAAGLQLGHQYHVGGAGVGGVCR